MKIFKRVFFCFLLTLLLQKSYGQYTKTLISDRPGKALKPFTPGKNVFVLQSGLLYEEFSRGEGSGIDVASFSNNTQFRWGLAKEFELNATFEFSREKWTIADSTLDINSGLSDLQVGTRYIVHEGERFVPTIGFQFSVLLNLLSSSFDPQDVAPSFSLITHQELNEKISFVTNSGISWNGNNSDPQGNYVLNLNFRLAESYGLILENYGTLYDKNLNTFFGAGAYYLISDNFQADFSGGYGNNAGEGSFFGTIGFSWRFKRGYYYYQEYIE